MLRVVRGDGQADLGVCLKAAIGREHEEAGRLERVLWRQQDAPMVDATLRVHPSTLSACQRSDQGLGTWKSDC